MFQHHLTLKALRDEPSLKGLEDVKSNVDTLLIIPNQNLFKVSNEQTSFAEAFKKADNVLFDGVKGLTDLITQPGLINLDFADVRTVIKKWDLR